MNTQRLKVTGIIALIALSLAAVGYSVHTERKFSQLQADAAKAATLEAKLKQEREQEEADLRLGQYVINMMYRTGAGNRLSDGKKQVLARAIVRVSNEIFEKVEHKHAFIGALAIESSFDRFAQSPTGPKGYAQLAKSAFHEGIQNCAIGKVDDDDVWETDLNLYAGACYFRALLEQKASDGDPVTAMVMYNQGPNSEAAKSYAKSGHLDNIEALKYIAKAGFLKKVVTDKKTPGIPSIEDLNKVSPKATSLKK